MYHADRNVGTDVAHAIPILIPFVKMLVLRQVRIVQIEWKRIGKLVGKLLKRRRAIRLGIIGIKFRQCIPNAVVAQHAAHRRNVKIIPRRVTLQRQYGLDPEHLFFRRDSQSNAIDLYLDRL